MKKLEEMSGEQLVNLLEARFSDMRSMLRDLARRDSVPDEMKSSVPRDEPKLVRDRETNKLRPAQLQIDGVFAAVCGDGGIRIYKHEWSLKEMQQLMCWLKMAAIYHEVNESSFL